MCATTTPGNGDLRDRRIIVGLCGGIACYKVATVVSRLVQRGATVTCAMTESATKFIAPLTFESLSGRHVYASVWDHVESNDPQHIRLAREADLMLIAPATMSMVARLAHGFADDPVSLIASAIDPGKTPVLIAPSMNSVMLSQHSTQRNLNLLREAGFRILEPATGWQACRTSGPGRLPEPEELLRTIDEALRSV
jgi:phosphopantothenoylcysteine decarboxylase/phosphopantothenate--cysteine ligase